MLNKNQSKKWNSWKYALIIPILIGFLLYFQVNVIAQEKHAPNVVASTQDVFVVIDKNTTDKQLKEESNRLKAEGITLKFSKVKRNSADEIIAIKVVYRDKNGSSGTSRINGDEPIKPLRFFKNDDGAIGFGTTKQMQIFKRGNRGSDTNIEEVIEIDSDLAEVPEAPKSLENVDAPEAPEKMEAPEPPMPPGKHPRVFIKNLKDKNVKISVTLNGETVYVDVDKIVDEALADMDFNFNFDSDDATEDIQEHMKTDKIEIEKMRPQMMRTRRDMERSQPDMEDAKRELEEAKKEMEQARREMENAKKQLEQSRKEFEMQRTQPQKN